MAIRSSIYEVSHSRKSVLSDQIFSESCTFGTTSRLRLKKAFHPLLRRASEVFKPVRSFQDVVFRKRHFLGAEMFDYKLITSLLVS